LKYMIWIPATKLERAKGLIHCNLTLILSEPEKFHAIIGPTPYLQ
jgi:hypothetical protein